MTERLLCDRGLRVGLESHDHRLVLTISDSETLRFRIAPGVLEGALGDETLQLSSEGSYCRIERVADRIHIEFGLSGELGSQCEIPCFELHDALAALRGPDRPNEGAAP